MGTEAARQAGDRLPRVRLHLLRVSLRRTMAMDESGEFSLLCPAGSPSPSLWRTEPRLAWWRSPCMNRSPLSQRWRGGARSRHSFPLPPKGSSWSSSARSHSGGATFSSSDAQEAVQGLPASSRTRSTRGARPSSRHQYDLPPEKRRLLPGEGEGTLLRLDESLSAPPTSPSSSAYGREPPPAPPGRPTGTADL